MTQPQQTHGTGQTSVNVSESSTTTCAQRLSQKGCVSKLITAVLLVTLLIYIIVDSLTTGNIRDVLTKFLDWIEDLGFLGAVLFACVYVVATVLLVPGSILTIGAGFVFTQSNQGNQAVGTLIATVVVFFGATIGAIFAFLFARFVFQDTVSTWTENYKIFRAIDKAIEHNGLKIVFLLRLSPAIPFSVLNYLLGTTRVELKEYIMACIGLLPGTTAFCFIGSTLSSLTQVSGEEKTEKTRGERTVQFIVLIVGIIASIVAVVLVTVYAKKELKKHLQDENVDPTPNLEAVEALSTDHVSSPQFQLQHNYAEQYSLAKN